jgi:hypothetical protein
MQSKKTIVVLGMLVIIVGAAAFIGGRLLNGKAGPLGFGGLLPGKGGMVSISVQITPAPELPTTQPEVMGLFVERKDNSITVSSIPMKGGGGGVVISTGAGDSGPSTSGGPSSDGPKVEVVITGDTTIYLETTQPSGPPASGEEVVLQQTVAEGSLDDLTSQSFVTVWGRKSGDRIIAEVVFISNPVFFKRPAP